jgi:hypothetical protein
MEYIHVALDVVQVVIQVCQFSEKHLSGGHATWNKMVYVFQQILCYWTWLKQDTFWMVGDELQSLWPWCDGLEWNLTKLHKQFHVPLDIHRNGVHPMPM